MQLPILLIVGVAIIVSIVALVWYMIRSMSKETLCTKPTLIRNFLSASDCDKLIEYVEKASCLERSEVKEETSVKSKSRTSSTCFVSDDQSPVASAFRAQVERLTGIPRAHFEDVQVVKYLPGQKYEAHYDVNKDDPRDEIRQVTVLVYLNDDFEGGETEFPEAKVKVKPEKGMAVVWENVDATGKVLPCALHAALPVKRGVKYACTVWVRGFGQDSDDP